MSDEPGKLEAAVGRAIIGTFSGVVFGAVTAGLLQLRDIAWSPWVLMGAGAVVFAAIAVAAGGFELPGKARDAAIGAILGVLIGGLLIGAFVYPHVMMAFETSRHGKIFGGYQYVGLLAGTPLGAVAGAIAGLCVGRRRKQPHVKSRRPE